MTRRNPLVAPLLLASAIVATACGGPAEPLTVGVKGVPTDVLLGNRKPPPSRPVPLPPDDAFAVPGIDPVAAPTRLGARTTAPVGSTVPPVTATAACPPVDPLAAPELVADQSITEPPFPDVTYAYRNVGRFETGGANASSGATPADSTRTVRNLRRNSATVKIADGDDTWFEYDVVSTLGDTVTTTTYAIVPEQDRAVMARAFAGAQPGLFLAAIATKEGTAPASTFDPEPNLLLLPFPATNAATFSSAGTDPRTGQTLAFQGTIGQKDRVDACGTVLDSLTLHLDGAAGAANPNGVGIDPSDGSRQSFVADYKLGPQFGGLSLADTVDMTIVRGGITIHRRNSATISARPRACRTVVLNGKATCAERTA